MANQNLALLSITAKLLEPVLDELVFVGGCATGLLVSDQAAGEVRPTFDVDAIAAITSYVEYTTFGERLHELGFSEDASEGAPICRWQHGQIKLDLMPLDETILGFSNRWYVAAMESAQTFELEGKVRIRLVTAPYFCATKLEAFKGRGKGDYFFSSNPIKNQPPSPIERQFSFEHFRSSGKCNVYETDPDWLRHRMAGRSDLPVIIRW